jgi:FAD synthetase
MKKTVMCFGAFDGLHAGHEDYFRQAKEYGDELIVIVARDRTIVELTGNLPSMNENDRLALVNEHPLVDEARLGHLDDRYRVIEEAKPDIICLGHDQEAFTENLDNELARRGLSANIVRCFPYEPPSAFKTPYEAEEELYTEAEYEERGLPL